MDSGSAARSQQVTRRRERSWRGLVFRVVAVVAGSGVALTIGEVGLRQLERAQQEQPARHDARLGWRPEHFRNVADYASPRIVAIGDSQTWGVNASASQTWPAELQRRSRVPVQNLSLGGYGPPQYLVLLQEARDLHPKVAIVALYLGNDLWEAYHTVYTLDSWKFLRLTDVELTAERDPVKAAADHYWMTKTASISTFGRWPPAHWPLWLRGHSAVCRLLDRAGFLPGEEPWSQAARAWADTSGEGLSVYGGNPTVLTVGLRASALDQDEPRVAEGLRLSRIFIDSMADISAAAGIRLMLVLIPTKETVYGEAHPELARHPALARLAADERAARGRLAEQATHRSVAVLDLTAALGERVRAGVRLYPPTEDGHFSQRGYAEVAGLVFDALQRHRLLSDNSEPNSN